MSRSIHNAENLFARFGVIFLSVDTWRLDAELVVIAKGAAGLDWQKVTIDQDSREEMLEYEVQDAVLCSDSALPGSANLGLKPEPIRLPGSLFDFSLTTTGQAAAPR